MIHFDFLGQHDGRFLFAAKTRGAKGLDAHRFEMDVAEWMLNEASGEWRLGNDAVAALGDSARDFPDDGEGFVLYAALHRLVDVILFEQRFPVRGLTLDHVLPELEAA